MSDWTIYNLIGDCGCIYYVGITNDIRRRMKEHRTRYCSSVRHVVVEEGSGRETGLQRELYWIEKLTSDGVLLTNKIVRANGGAPTHTKSTRAVISRKGKGRVFSEEHKAKIRANTKGKKRNWSPEGEAAVRTTQFKPGVSTWSTWSDELREIDRARRKARWDHIPPEQRSLMSTERNNAAWAKRTPEQRAAIGKAISEAQKRRFQNGGKKATFTPEQRAENGRKISATRQAQRAAREAALASQTS